MVKPNNHYHPIRITYNCTDCVFVFTIHSHCDKLYCPKCGDYISVVPFVKTKKEWRPWTEDELSLVDRIVAGELLKYQVAATLGRTYGAVQKKVEKRRRDMV